MAEKKKEVDALFDEEFSARVNHGDPVETILRQIGSTPTLILRGKSSKFSSDKKYRVMITEVVEPEPLPAQEITGQ